MTRDGNVTGVILTKYFMYEGEVYETGKYFVCHIFRLRGCVVIDSVAAFENSYII